MHATIRTCVHALLEEGVEVRYYMIEGGSNWKAMTEYLKNPQNSPGVKGDDFGVLRDSIGKTVHLHGMRNSSDN